MMKKLIMITALILMAVSVSVSYAAERMTVIVDKANIRSGPGKKHEVIWMVEKYHPISVIKKTGKWFRFTDFEGDIGWIHSSLLSKIPAVIALKDQCNIRSGPGIDHKVIFVVEKGIPFKVLDRKAPWIHIEHSDGDQGWIHQSLVW